MTKLSKLIERVRARPPEAAFDDVRRLLEAFGWTVGRQKGSHVTFVKGREAPIVFPLSKGRRVARVYLDYICERLGLDD